MASAVNTVLVTGAGGFVGSAIVRRLVEDRATLWDGHPIDHIVAAVRPGGSLERLEAIEETPGWSVEPVDLRDASSARDLVTRSRPRAVVHAALDSTIHHGAEIGHGPLAALLDVLDAAGDARFVHVGSAWVLASGTDLAEIASVDPRTAYARHKLEEDRLVANTRVPWINLRLFNLFGRYESPTRLVPTLVARLRRGEKAEVTHGAQLRDFNDVDDAAAAFALALRAPDEAWNALYHIGSGRPTSVRALVAMVAELTGNANLVRFGAESTHDQDLAALTADSRLAARKLGWSVAAVLEDRVRKAVEWWLDRLATDLTPRPAEESLR